MDIPEELLELAEESKYSIVTPETFNRRDENQLIHCTLDNLKEEEELGRICFLFPSEAERFLKTPKRSDDGEYKFIGFLAERIGLHRHFRGWENITQTLPKRVDYLHIDPSSGIKDRDSYKIQCRLKNAVKPEALDLVCEKKNLHKNVTKFVPKTYPLDSFEYPTTDKKGVYIVKPSGVGAYKGEGISVVKNPKELTEARKLIQKNKRWTGIVSEIVDNPMLFRGKKFHLRVYMLVTPNEYFLFDSAHILTAKKTFVKGVYTKDVFDTHGASTPEDWEFPRDFSPDNKDQLWDKVRKICDEIWKPLKGRIRPYEESESGFELICPDIMFSSDGKAWLLEVNRKAGLDPSVWNEDYGEWLDRLYSWMFGTCIDPFFSTKEIVEVVEEKKNTLRVGQRVKVLISGKPVFYVAESISDGAVLLTRDKFESLVMKGDEKEGYKAASPKGIVYRAFPLN